MTSFEPMASPIIESFELQGKVASLTSNLQAKDQLLHQITQDNQQLSTRLQHAKLELNNVSTASQQYQFEIQRLKGDNNNLLQLITKLEQVNNALQNDYIAKLEYEHGMNSKIRQLSYQLAKDNLSVDFGSNQAGLYGLIGPNGQLVPNLSETPQFQQLTQRIKQLEKRLQEKSELNDRLLNKLELTQVATKTMVLDLNHKLQAESALNITLQQQFNVLSKQNKEFTSTLAALEQTNKVLQDQYNIILIDHNTVSTKLLHTEEREKSLLQRNTILDKQYQEGVRAEMELKLKLQELRNNATLIEFEYNKLNSLYLSLEQDYQSQHERVLHLLVDKSSRIDKNDISGLLEQQCAEHIAHKYLSNNQLEQLLESAQPSSALPNPSASTQRSRSILNTHKNHFIQGLTQFLISHFESQQQLHANETVDQQHQQQPNRTNDNEVTILENGLIVSPVGTTISIPQLYKQHVQLLSSHKTLQSTNDSNSKQLLELQNKLSTIIGDMSARLEESWDQERSKFTDELNALRGIIKQRDDELEITKRNKVQLSNQLQTLIRGKMSSGSGIPQQGQVDQHTRTLLQQLTTLPQQQQQDPNQSFNSSFNTTASPTTHSSAPLTPESFLVWNSVEELQGKYQAVVQHLYSLQTQLHNVTEKAQHAEQQRDQLEHNAQQSSVDRAAMTMQFAALNAEYEKVKNQLHEELVNKMQNTTTHRDPSSNVMFTTSSDQMSDSNFNSNFNSNSNSNPSTPNSSSNFLQLQQAQHTLKLQEERITQLTSQLDKTQTSQTMLESQHHQLQTTHQSLTEKYSHLEQLSTQQAEQSRAYFTDFVTIKGQFEQLKFTLQHQEQVSATLETAHKELTTQNDELQKEYRLLTTKFHEVSNESKLLQFSLDEYKSKYQHAVDELQVAKANESMSQNRGNEIHQEYQAKITALLEKVQSLTDQREELLLKLGSGFSTPVELNQSIYVAHNKKFTTNHHYQPPSASPQFPSSLSSVYEEHMADSNAPQQQSPPSTLESMQTGHHNHPSPLQQHSHQQQSQQSTDIIETITLREHLRQYKQRYEDLKTQYEFKLKQSRHEQESLTSEKLSLRSQLLEQQQQLTTFKFENQGLQNCVKQLEEKVRAFVTTRLLNAGIVVSPASSSSLTAATSPINESSDPTSTSTLVSDVSSLKAQQVTIDIAQLEEMITLTAQTKSFQSQLLALKTELEAVMANLQDTTQSLNELQSAHTLLQTQHGELNTEYTARGDRIITLDNEFNALQHLYTQLTTQHASLNDAHKILQAQYDAVVTARDTALADLERTFKSLTAMQAQSEQTKMDFENAQKAVQVQLHDQTQQYQSLQQQHTQVSRQHEQLKQQYQQLEQTKVSLEEQIANVEEELERVNTQLHLATTIQQQQQQQSTQQTAQSVMDTSGMSDFNGSLYLDSSDPNNTFIQPTPSSTSINDNNAKLSELIVSLRLDKDDLIQQIDQLKLQYDQLQGTYSDSHEEQVSLQNQLKVLNQQYNDLQTEFQKTSLKCAQLSTDKDTLLSEQQIKLQTIKQLENTIKDISSNNTMSLRQDGVDCEKCHEYEIKLNAKETILTQRNEQLGALHKQYKLLVEAKYILSADSDTFEDVNAVQLTSPNGTPVSTAKQRNHVVELLKASGKIQEVLTREEQSHQQLQSLFDQLLAHKSSYDLLSQQHDVTMAEKAALAEQLANFQHEFDQLTQTPLPPTTTPAPAIKRKLQQSPQLHNDLESTSSVKKQKVSSPIHTSATPTIPDQQDSATSLLQSDSHYDIPTENIVSMHDTDTDELPAVGQEADQTEQERAEYIHTTDQDYPIDEMVNTTPDDAMHDGDAVYDLSASISFDETSLPRVVDADMLNDNDDDDDDNNNNNNNDNNNNVADEFATDSVPVSTSATPMDLSMEERTPIIDHSIEETNPIEEALEESAPIEEVTDEFIPTETSEESTPAVESTDTMTAIEETLPINASMEDSNPIEHSIIGESIPIEDTTEETQAVEESGMVDDDTNQEQDNKFQTTPPTHSHLELNDDISNDGVDIEEEPSHQLDSFEIDQSPLTIPPTFPPSPISTDLPLDEPQDGSTTDPLHSFEEIDIDQGAESNLQSPSDPYVSTPGLHHDESEAVITDFDDTHAQPDLTDNMDDVAVQDPTNSQVLEDNSINSFDQAEILDDNSNLNSQLE